MVVIIVIIVPLSKLLHEEIVGSGFWALGY